MGRLYVANSIGCVLGSLMGGHLLLPAFGLRGALLGVAALNLLAAAVSSAFSRSSASFTVALPAVAIAFTLVPQWDNAVLSSGPYIYGSAYQDAATNGLDVEGVIRACGKVIFHRDGAYATTTVRKAPGGLLSLQVNGKTDASNKADLFTQRMIGHLPLLFHPDPKEVLVIGLGSGVTAGAVLRHPIERMDLLEIAPEVVEASRYFDGLTGAPLKDPRTELHIEDGRAWVEWTDRTYDVISSEPSNPWVAGMANLFTQEYFTACRNRLSPKGLMVQWVQAYSTSPEDFQSVVATFQSVFPQTTLWKSSNQTDFVLIGHPDQAKPDAQRILQTMQANTALGAGLRSDGFHPQTLVTSFVADFQGVQRLAQGARLVLDNDPFLEFTGPKNLYKDQTKLVQDLVRTHGGVSDIRSLFRNGQVLETERQSLATALETRDQAIALAVAGKGPEALALLETALTYLPKDEHALDAYGLLLKDMARSLRKKERPEEAVLALNRLLKVAPQDAEALHLRGLSFTEQGKYQAARSDLEQCLKLVPQDPIAYRNLSVVLYKLNDTQGALGAYLKALNGTKPTWQEWKNLGELYRALGKFPKAALAWKKTLELNPKQPKLKELFDMYVNTVGTDGIATNLDGE